MRSERWHELQEFPEWSFADGSRFPTRAQLFAERNRVLARHPDVTFVGAHMGSSSEDLDQLGTWLDRYPNFHVDLAASINELGRQPYKARRFLIRYHDRVLFGTDLKSAKTPGYEVYARFLETEDEYFGTEPANDRQGFWMIYGMYLPRPVLQKIYRDNARRLLRLETPEELPARR
jgi:predicted TIM-barrel fold metal-dependent hydrolase